MGCPLGTKKGILQVSNIKSLTPQMINYSDDFSDSGHIAWEPYLMYFHPKRYCSPTVNTDSCGFRYSEFSGKKYSVIDKKPNKSFSLLAGSSTVFGIGATSDEHTLSSRLSLHDKNHREWLNFGGRSFNSAQELILLTMYAHHLEHVDEIILFSGFNNLGLARLPEGLRLEHGAFFSCNAFFDAMCKNNKNSFVKKYRHEKKVGIPPSIEEQISIAAHLTLRHLALWKMFAKSRDAKLTFVLQPLANWVRPEGTKEEVLIFEELERQGGFSQIYGDILKPEVCFEYAKILKQGAEQLNIKFVNISPIVADSVQSEDWVFVDRIHFTDYGYDLVAKILLGI